MPQPLLLHPNRTRPSAAIRRANELLRNLLLAEDADELVLVGYVTEGLERVSNELENLAGRQELFEMWSS